MSASHTQKVEFARSDIDTSRLKLSLKRPPPRIVRIRLTRHIRGLHVYGGHKRKLGSKFENAGIGHHAEKMTGISHLRNHLQQNRDRVRDCRGLLAGGGAVPQTRR